MGEKQNQPFQLSFNASLKVDFQGSQRRGSTVSTHISLSISSLRSVC
jgi:hypothetical protein